jgi:hypothetical protein
MTRFRTLDHPMIGMVAWDPDRPAERINDHILMVRATSNAYLISADEGDVVINTGTPAQGKPIREKFEEALGRPLKVAKIIYTQRSKRSCSAISRGSAPSGRCCVRSSGRATRA